MDMSMLAALYIYIFCFMTGFVFMAMLYYYIDQGRSNYHNFFWFFVLCLFGTLLIPLRDQLGDLLGVVVSNLALVVGYMMIPMGIHKVYGKQDQPIVYLTLGIVFLVGQLYATYIDYQVLARVYLFNIITGFILSYGLVALWRIRRLHPATQEVLSIALVMILVMIVARIINITIHQETTNEFLSYQYDGFFIVLVAITNLFIIPGIMSIIKNQKEQALHRSEQSKASLISNLPGFVYRGTMRDTLSLGYVSKGFAAITGYDSSMVEQGDIDFLSLVEESDKERLRQSREDAIANQTRHQMEYRIRTANGDWRWIREQGIGIYAQDGQLLSFEGYVSDIHHQKELENHLTTMSRIDALTSLDNRRSLMEYAPRIWRQCMRERTPLSVLMIDLDDFKLYNDQFGHLMGDQALQEVAQALKRLVHRPLDLVCRFGGEEFVIVLYDCDGSAAERKAAAIHEEIRALNIYLDESKTHPISVSIGYASVVAESDIDFDRALDEADRFMYQAKHQGKNQTVGDWLPADRKPNQSLDE
jgi:diguanylate cyclase (GGDEF)-like protein/PAS domain S-box-containing protein